MPVFAVKARSPIYRASIHDSTEIRHPPASDTTCYGHRIRFRLRPITMPDLSREWQKGHRAVPSVRCTRTRTGGPCPKEVDHRATAKENREDASARRSRGGVRVGRKKVRLALFSSSIPQVPPDGFTFTLLCPRRSRTGPPLSSCPSDPNSRRTARWPFSPARRRLARPRS